MAVLPRSSTLVGQIYRLSTLSFRSSSRHAMFRSLGLFGGISCPYHSTCTLPNCLFTHSDVAVVANQQPSQQVRTFTVVPRTHQQSRQEQQRQEQVQYLPPQPHPKEIKKSITEHLPKRRKIDHDEKGEVDESAESWVHLTEHDTAGPVESKKLNPVKNLNSKATKATTNPNQIITRKTVRREIERSARNTLSGPNLKSALKKDTLINSNDAAASATNKDSIKEHPKVNLPVAKSANPAETHKVSTSTTIKTPVPAGSGTATTTKLESLIPRTVPNPPATFAVRLEMLTALHNEYVRLNPSSNVGGSIGTIRKALREEEDIARENSKTYGVMMRNRIFALKKTTVEDFQKERAAAYKAKLEEAEKNRQPVSVNTQLSIDDEIRALSAFVHSFDDLKRYNYLLLPPTDAQLEEVRRGLTSAAGHEECDRCKSRFQVFPGRRQEDGALTSGGTCTYHWGKQLFQRRILGAGDLPKIWDCCKADVGTSPGCTTFDHHVFSVREQKRLAALWQYVETPEAPDEFDEDNGKLKAICIDCEMSYTTQGLELVRVTATKYPTFEMVIDVLVRPLGEMLDANTRFSGVTAKQLVDAVPYSPSDIPSPTSDSTSTKLPIVGTPAAARDAILSLINRSTILIGHALNNDLDTLRMIHPRIVDTAILFPTRSGPPSRYALKWLSKRYLARDIQIAGAEGHDSKEDANSAGDLVRWRIAEAVKAKKVDQNGKWLVSPTVWRPQSMMAATTTTNGSG